MYFGGIYRNLYSKNFSLIQKNKIIYTLFPIFREIRVFSSENGLPVLEVDL